jgi:hypothetical protein
MRREFAEATVATVLLLHSWRSAVGAVDPIAGSRSQKQRPRNNRYADSRAESRFKILVSFGKET